MADTSFIQPIGTYTAAAGGPLGHIAWGFGNRRFIYVKFLDAVTYTVGMVCTPASDLGLYYVTNDYAGGTSSALRFAGAIPNVDATGNTVTAVPAQNEFGYVQLDGYHSAIRTDGGDDIAAWDTLVMDGTTDGTVDSVAKATVTGDLSACGFAAAVDVDASNTVPAWLKCLVW